MEQEARDIRKQLDEMRQKAEQEKNEQNQKDEPKEPRDPNDRTNAKKDPPGAGDSRQNDVPPWMVSLPPQLRDAWVRGDFEKVPPEYKELIERYLIWLTEAAREEERTPRAR